MLFECTPKCRGIADACGIEVLCPAGGGASGTAGDDSAIAADGDGAEERMLDAAVELGIF